MKHSFALPATVLAASLALAACGGDDTAAPGPGSAPTAPASGHSMPSEAATSAAPTPSDASTSGPSTSAIGTPAAGPHNAADVMFATMMIGHHAQAVEMSDMLLAKPDVDPLVRSLAERIKTEQGPEIEQMRGWLAGWGETVPPVDGSMSMDHPDGEMPGMMTEKDMAKLERATGTAASRLFLEQMTAHHKGAIQMAQTEVANGENPDATELANMIIETQQAEIQEMQELATEL